VRNETSPPPAPELDWRASTPPQLTSILTSALEAFSESGYHGTTVRDIARRVGVTVPALYYHHENKEAILFALMDLSTDHLRKLVDLAIEEADGDVETRFFHLVECIVRFMGSSGRIAALNGETRALSPHLRKIYADKRHAIETILVETIAEGVAAGLFSATLPSATGRALLGMIQAISTWYHPEGELSVDQIAARYEDIAAHTVGAVPEVLARHRDHSGVTAAS
jgi:AcrR family transcriptional regulator